MDTFAELDRYLAQEFSLNYWSDDAITYAQELVQRLTGPEWDQLRSVWASRPPVWQQRCAEILNWGNSSEAQRTLLEMAQSADDDVVVAAADSLRALQEEGVNAGLTPAVVRRLTEVAVRGGLSAVAIRGLLDGTKTGD